MESIHNPPDDTSEHFDDGTAGWKGHRELGEEQLMVGLASRSIGVESRKKRKRTRRRTGSADGKDRRTRRTGTVAAVGGVAPGKWKRFS